MGRPVISIDDREKMMGIARRMMREGKEMDSIAAALGYSTDAKGINKSREWMRRNGIAVPSLMGKRPCKQTY